MLEGGATMNIINYITFACNIFLYYFCTVLWLDRRSTDVVSLLPLTGWFKPSVVSPTGQSLCLCLRLDLSRPLNHPAESSPAWPPTLTQEYSRASTEVHMYVVT